jgi:broad specificity phosphatase PhoE
VIALYLTHPQVAVDPETPVPDWRLSDGGRRRVEAILHRPWIGRVGRVVSSPERKARETAGLVAAHRGLDIEVLSGSGENDRSATGYLPPEAFEAAADRFFAEPDASWRGWERARDAADRIYGAVDGLLSRHPPAVPLLIAGHGAVGTLLKCRLASRPIARREDQPGGGGNVFAFTLRERKLVCDWTPMEEFDA